MVASCNALGLFGGERLVLVRGVEGLDDGQVAGHRRLPGRSHARHLPGHVRRQGDRRGRIRWPRPSPRSATSASSTRPTTSTPPSGWSSASPSRASPARSRVARRIVKRAGDRDRRPRAGGREAGDLRPRRAAPTEADVDLLVAEQLDVKPWNMTDAWGRRDAAGVISFATADIEKPGRRAAHLGHLRQPRAPRPPGAAGDGGGRVAEGGAEAAGPALAVPGRKGCAGRRARSASRSWRGRSCGWPQLDEAIKGGSRLDPRLELELALVEISAG